MKKIGEIKGIPVVEGNINEVTKNQIHYKEDSGSIQLSKRGNDNKLNSVTGSGGSSNGNLENTDIKCYEYIRFNGDDFIYNLSPDFINICAEQSIPLPNVLCAYGDYEYARGSWKALVDMPMDKAFKSYNNNSNTFEQGLAGNIKCFGYIFNNMTASTNEGVVGSPFLDDSMIKSIFDKDIIDTLGIDLCILTTYKLLSEDPNAQGNINEVLRETIKTMEFKEITLTEYYTTQYQKAKEYYNSLEPVS